MADVKATGTLFDFVLNTNKQQQSGTLTDYPDLADPSNIGTPTFTQDQIDALKRVANEILNRYPLPGGGGAE